MGTQAAAQAFDSSFRYQGPGFAHGHRGRVSAAFFGLIAGQLDGVFQLGAKGLARVVVEIGHVRQFQIGRLPNRQENPARSVQWSGGA